MAEVLGDRPVAVTRELTKLHEEVLRGTASEISAVLAARPQIKGEITLVVGPPGDDSLAPSATDIDEALRDAAASMPASQAAAEVARRLGIPKKQAYRRLLELKDGKG